MGTKKYSTVFFYIRFFSVVYIIHIYEKTTRLHYCKGVLIMNPQEEINNSEYANPANWHYSLYASKKDSRIVVLSRGRSKVRTVNFAKPLGIMIHVFNTLVLTVLVVLFYARYFAK